MQPGPGPGRMPGVSIIHGKRNHVMRTQLLTGALAVVATSALVGLGTTTATARVAPAPEKTREVGTLIECAGYVEKVLTSRSSANS